MIQGPSDPSSFSCRLKRPICIASWSLCIRFYFFNFYYALPKTFFSFLKKRKGEKKKKTKKRLLATTHWWYAAKVQTDVPSINALRDRQGRSPSKWWRGKAENWSSAATLQKKALRDTCTAKFMREKTETVSARSCKYYAAIVVQWCFFLTTVYLIILLVRHCDEKTRAVT